MLFLCVVLAITGMCGASRNIDTKFRIGVPAVVAEQATRYAAGDRQMSPPVLMLEGLEVGSNEGLKIKVLGEPQAGSSEPAVLAVTGVVGHSQNSAQPPLRKINLPVPLNEKAAPLLKGQSEVTLTLRLEHNGAGHPPLKVDRVYFITSE